MARSLLRRVVLLEEMSGDVRPKFNEFRANNAFCGNRERPVYCLPKASIRGRIIGV
jgi:hypothetical protein